MQRERESQIVYIMARGDKPGQTVCGEQCPIWYFTKKTQKLQQDTAQGDPGQGGGSSQGDSGQERGSPQGSPGQGGGSPQGDRRQERDFPQGGPGQERGCSPQTVLVEEYSSSSDEFELDDQYKHNPSAPAPTTLLNLLLQFSVAC